MDSLAAEYLGEARALASAMNERSLTVTPLRARSRIQSGMTKGYFSEPRREDERVFG